MGQWVPSSPSAGGSHRGQGFLGKGWCCRESAAWGSFEGSRGSEWEGQKAGLWVGTVGKDSLNGGRDKYTALCLWVIDRS